MIPPPQITSPVVLQDSSFRKKFSGYFEFPKVVSKFIYLPSLSWCRGCAQQAVNSVVLCNAFGLRSSLTRWNFTLPSVSTSLSQPETCSLKSYVRQCCSSSCMLKITPALFTQSRAIPDIITYCVC